MVGGDLPWPHVPEVTWHLAEEPRLEPRPDAADPAQSQGDLVRLVCREMVRGGISVHNEGACRDSRVFSSLIHTKFILCVR